MKRKERETHMPDRNLDGTVSKTSSSSLSEMSKESFSFTFRIRGKRRVDPDDYNLLRDSILSPGLVAILPGDFKTSLSPAVSGKTRLRAKQWGAQGYFDGEFR